ncbi:hypothetical protein PITC_090130 [Penicillium italicum]|uniref:Uncharacterized protein n=1 Tax=Penicillium italicum TaxID=40296 RepID=A0A0A2L9R2_PENIT|nr:hypothetical protein PITC_090130 [Penicillium italicum]
MTNLCFTPKYQCSLRTSLTLFFELVPAACGDYKVGIGNPDAVMNV